jgi:hypothetical protein
MEDFNKGPKTPDDFEKEFDEFEASINGAKSPEELCAAIRKAGVIDSPSGNTYGAEEIARKIEMVHETIKENVAKGIEMVPTRKIPLLLDITKAYGIRDKAIELLDQLRKDIADESEGSSSEGEPDYGNMTPTQLEADPVASKVLQEKALQYLMTHDREWFMKNYDGSLDDEGYLREKSGEALTTPMQNIGGGEAFMWVIQETKRALLKDPNFVQPYHGKGMD